MYGNIMFKKTFRDKARVFGQCTEIIIMVKKTFRDEAWVLGQCTEIIIMVKKLLEMKLGFWDNVRKL